jgi:hypothetical protein
MARGASETRWLWWTIAGCVFVVVSAPVIISARPAPVLAVALVGGAVGLVVGIGAAIARIIWTHGMPLGERDPLLDAQSPYLRPGNRLGLLLAIGLIVFGIGGMSFSVYWYPRPDPFLPGVSPESYILPGLLLTLFILAFGVYWLVVTLYWARVVRRTRRSSATVGDLSPGQASKGDER